MWKAYLNDVLFFDTSANNDAYILTSARLSLTAGASGSFTFTIPPCNLKYGQLNRLIDIVDVYKNETKMFSGRVRSIQKQFDTQEEIVCEGLLSVLADSVLRPFTHEGTLHELFEAILENHNTQVGDEKKIRKGYVTVTDRPAYRPYENIETSISRLMDLVSSFGGFLNMRRESNGLYLDWLAEYDLPTNQEITLGQNLIDLTMKKDGATVVTALIPQGALLDDGTRVNVKSVNAGNDYVLASNENLAKYGIIYDTQIWDDVYEPANLLQRANQFIATACDPEDTINVTAVDLADAGYEVTDFNVGQHIKVVSSLHDFNANFAIANMTIDLFHPANNRLILGKVLGGYISQIKRNTDVVRKRIEQMSWIYTPKGVMEDAIESATQLITGNLGGYIILHDSDNDGYPDELLIMDTDNIETATKVWRFNSSGLGYSRTGYTGDYGLAMTMDGAIVADRITTGVMSADRVKAGIIRGIAGDSYWNLETGELYVHGYPTTTEVNTAIAGLQSQIDGNIQSWSGEDEPTLENYPAVQWETAEDKLTHVGDIYYDGNGKCYRFAQDGDVFKWVLISDTDISKALTDAAEALSEIQDINGLLVTDYYTKTQTDSQISAAEGRLTSTMQSDYTSLIAFKSANANNLIPYPYHRADTYTHNGITYTVNDDLSVTANGTATANSTYHFRGRTGDINPLFLSEGTYTLSGCPSGGGTSTYRLRVNETYNGAARGVAGDSGNGATFTVDAEHATCQKGIYIEIYTGTTVNNLVFKPMLEKGYVAHDYVSYADSIGGVQASVQTTDNKVSTLEQTVDGFKTEVSETYSTKTEAQGYATAAQTAAEATASADATSKANTAEANAKGYTDTRLTSYSTTADMNSAINQKASEITASVAGTYTTKQEYKTGVTENLTPWMYYRAKRNSNPWINNGLTWTLNDDGTISVVGTATANSWYQLGTNVVEDGTAFYLPTGTYTLTGCPSGGANNKYRLQCYEYDGTGTSAPALLNHPDYGNGVTFTISEKRYCRLECGVSSGQTVDLTFKPMLVRGSIAQDYIPAYDSSAKNRTMVDIEERVSSAELKITDSAIIATVMESDTYTQSTNVINLLPSVYYRENEMGKNTSWTSNGITWAVNKDGSVTANGTATADSFFALNEYKDSYSVPVMRVDTSKKYILHGCPSGGSSSKYFLRCCQRADATSGTGSSNHYDYGDGVVITPTTGFVNFYCVIISGQTVSNLTFYPMFEVGTVKHAYVSTHDGTGALVTRMRSAESNIEINASGIASKVSQTDYNGNTIASLINQNATTVSISASKINLNGAVTANNYFKINTDGSMETISGKIGGWNITNSTLERLTPITSGTAAMQYRTYMANTNTLTNGNFGIQHRYYNGSEYGSWVNDFYVTTQGKLFAANAEITGTITSENATITGGSLNINSTNDAYAFLTVRNSTNQFSVTTGTYYTMWWNGQWYFTTHMFPQGLSLHSDYTSGGASEHTGWFAMHTPGKEGIAPANVGKTFLDVNYITYYDTLAKGSDKRLKTNIQPITIEQAYAFVENVRPVSYELIDSPLNVHHGMIAQEIREKINIQKNWQLVKEDSDGMLSLDYIEMIPDMLVVLQDLIKQVKLLKQEV